MTQHRLSPFMSSSLICASFSSTCAHLTAGADNQSSPINTFTVPCLDLVGQFSQLAQQDGYVVSLVPPESYLDPTTSGWLP